jgi:hypothetical protein
MQFKSRQSVDRTLSHFHAGRVSVAGRAVMTGCIEDEGRKMHSEGRQRRQNEDEHTGQYSRKALNEANFGSTQVHFGQWLAFRLRKISQEKTKPIFMIPSR